jgi:hypothetical protein
MALSLSHLFYWPTKTTKPRIVVIAVHLGRAAALMHPMQYGKVLFLLLCVANSNQTFLISDYSREVLRGNPLPPQSKAPSSFFPRFKPRCHVVIENLCSTCYRFDILIHSIFRESLDVRQMKEVIYFLRMLA